MNNSLVSSSRRACCTLVLLKLHVDMHIILKFQYSFNAGKFWKLFRQYFFILNFLITVL